MQKLWNEINENESLVVLEVNLYVGCVGGAGEVSVDLLKMTLRIPAPD